MLKPFSSTGFVTVFFSLLSKTTPRTLSLYFHEKQYPGLLPLFFSPRFKSTSSAAVTTVEEPLNHFDTVQGEVYSDIRGRTLNYTDNKVRLREYSRLLHDCVSKGSLDDGKAIHGNLVRSGIQLDSYLWVSLISFYSKCGDLDYACKVLDVMPARDVVSWTALISGFVDGGDVTDCACLFRDMCREGIRPNEFTLATVLKSCSLGLDLVFGKQVHTQAIKLGFLLDLYVGSTLVDVYAKCGSIESARKVFLGMPEQNAVTWSKLLNGYADQGDGKEAWKLFCEMKDPEIKFNKFTLSTLLKACANSEYTREGMVVHALVVRIGFEFNEILSCSLVNIYSKCGSANDALKVFRTIKNPDVVTWSSIITCVAQQGQREEVAKLFNLMRQTTAETIQFTIGSLVSAVSDLQYGESIHAFICKNGYESDNVLVNAMVTMYMRNGSMQGGTQLFDGLTDRDSVSWNALLSGFHDNENCDLGPQFFYQMLKEGFEPTMCTFISILKSCSSQSNIGFGKQLHTHIFKNSHYINDSVQTALVDMYAKTGCLEEAKVCFDRLIKRDIVSWSVMINNYVRTDQVEKGLRCFIQMQWEGIKPNEFTLTSCLSGCTCMTTIENGRLLHCMALKSGHLDDMFFCSALIDMYGKCGCLEDAEAIFKSLASHDVVLWNTLISLYSKHGQGENALGAFEMMLSEGFVPDKITFVAVLSACSYMGLVEEGRKHFTSLQKDYKISPTLEHYACMIDILGRAGKFNDVTCFIEEARLSSNVMILETLLAACKKHNNAELGPKVAQKLLELEPNTASSYILLSNIFAAKGRWKDFKKVRTLMSSRGIKKEPGCSWVEIDGQIHLFKSRDYSHPKITEIYLKLEELLHKLIAVGYKPKTECVLHDVTDQEKVEQLYGHSERLAFTYTLMCTSQTKVIRIFRNSQICEDCHDVMRLLSNITSREIIIRDINRFHRFKSGTCSCQEYW